MKLEDFLEKYSLTVIETNIENSYYLITTELVDNKSNEVINSIETKIEGYKLNDWISQTNSSISITRFSKEMIFDFAKRAQIDFFAQIFKIENFYPNNVATDISFVKTKIN